MPSAGRLIPALVVCTLILTGCAGSPPVEPETPRELPPVHIVVLPPAGAPARMTVPEWPAKAPGPQGTSVQERPISSVVYGHGPDTILIIGGIHGDEPAGVELCRRLCAYLEEHPDELAGIRVIVVPAANPDGLAAGRRPNARGVDANRNFDARNRTEGKVHGPAPLSEPESRFIVTLITHYLPARIVSIHQPLTCVDYDGPARRLAEATSKACGLPVRKLGARSGSLGSYAGVDLGIPTITLELPHSASKLTPEALWDLYGEALLVPIRFRLPE